MTRNIPCPPLLACTVTCGSLLGVSLLHAQSNSQSKARSGFRPAAVLDSGSQAYSNAPPQNTHTHTRPPPRGPRHAHQGGASSAASSWRVVSAASIIRAAARVHLRDGLGDLLLHCPAALLRLRLGVALLLRLLLAGSSVLAAFAVAGSRRGRSWRGAAAAGLTASSTGAVAGGGVGGAALADLLLGLAGLLGRCRGAAATGFEWHQRRVDDVDPPLHPGRRTG